jgi:hypothetical protein
MSPVPQEAELRSIESYAIQLICFNCKVIYEYRQHGMNVINSAFVSLKERRNGILEGTLSPFFWKHQNGPTENLRCEAQNGCFLITSNAL